MHLEVHGDQVHWTETFGFDNQAYHTATNKTPYNRLVFMVDIIKRGVRSLPEQEENNNAFLQQDLH